MPTQALQALVNISPKQRKFPVKVIISSVIAAIAGISLFSIIRCSNLQFGIIRCNNLQSDLIGNYNQLEKYLKTKDWQKANQETIDIMLKVTKRDSEDRLDDKSIKKFPCKDLVRLNQLWQDYSEGKFGFRAQKSKYEETGNITGKYNSNTFIPFGENTGWYQRRGWISDFQLDFSNEALPGHLPSSEILLDTLWHGQLFSRINVCQKNN
jgi:hypothetical protein